MFLRLNQQNAQAFNKGITMDIGGKIKRVLITDASKSDEWFAWRPVRTGALGTGQWAWMKRLWRNKCCGVVIYQPLNLNKKRVSDARQELNKRHLAARGKTIDLEELAKTSPNIYK